MYSCTIDNVEIDLLNKMLFDVSIITQDLNLMIQIMTRRFYLHPIKHVHVSCKILNEETKVLSKEGAEN